MMHQDIRAAVGRLCEAFPGSYWRALDRDRAYPTAFVDALTQSGYLAALIPQAYGGSGLPLGAAAAILEEIQASGCNGASCHAQMYVMGTLLRHGSEEQKQRYLPAIARGELRLQAFGVTEPDSGTDTASITTTARRDGDRYIIRGAKIWTSRAEQSDLMILLARTSPVADGMKRTAGLSVFLLDMREARQHGLTIAPIRTMMNHATTAISFDDVPVPAQNLIGKEGEGFRYILSGMNAERILIAAECVGDARWFIDRSTAYAKQRVVFGRPIGQNQGIQFPIARAYAGMRAAGLMVDEASRRTSPAARKPTWRRCWRRMPASRPPTSRSRPMAASVSPRTTTSNGNSAKRVSTRWRRSPPISSWLTLPIMFSASRGPTDG